MRILVLVAAVLLVQPSLAAEDYWRISSAGAACVLGNASHYLASGQDVLMIVVPACPEPDPQKALSAVSKNTAVPKVESSPDDDGVDDIIVLSRRGLECLARADLDLSADTVQLPKRPSC